MPMFYTPKPRQFHYRPRFYDPEKERWEALKQKYADERALSELRAAADSASAADGNTAPSEGAAVPDADLAYFQRRVQEVERDERQRKRGLTWRDLFRKREMPTFRYQPRFGRTEAAAADGDTTPLAPAAAPTLAERKRTAKIKRRFDIGDTEYMKPIPAGRIMLYAMLVCLLLYWILF